MASDASLSGSGRTSRFARALSRLAAPIGLFAASFFLGMALLAVLVSPARYPVHIGSTVMRAGELHERERALLIRQEELQSAIETAASLVPAPTLMLLAQERERRVPVGDAVFALTDALRALEGHGTVIRIAALTLDGEDRLFALTGTVEDASGRSVQVLAALVDRLRGSGVFSEVTEPAYRQSTGPDGSALSPFSLTLTLSHAQ